MEPTPRTPYDEVEDLIFEIELLLATCEIVRTQGRQRKAKTALSPLSSMRPTRGAVNRNEINREAENHRFSGQRHATGRHASGRRAA